MQASVLSIQFDHCAVCCCVSQGELQAASKAKFESEERYSELRQTFDKLEATVTSLSASQQGTARELIEQQVWSHTHHNPASFSA